MFKLLPRVTAQTLYSSQTSTDHPRVIF
uniref:Uncharacterized protein n=1 Tax=Anguilla anguilla TaxID=7936 RepID=A0A0E9W7E0_ANGAN